MEEFNATPGDPGTPMVIPTMPGFGTTPGKPQLKGANNGKRVERFEAKKKRKDVLESGNVQALFMMDLITFTTEGKLKVKPASAPGWLSASDFNEEASNLPQPTPGQEGDK